MSDVEYTNNELLDMIKKLQLRVDKLEKGEGKIKKKKNSPEPIQDYELTLYKEFTILKVESDHIIVLFSNPEEDVASTQRFDEQQWNKLCDQLKAKDNGDTLVIHDYSAGQVIMKTGENWIL